MLNEKREPERRGVCQHLLAKLDRTRVFSAAERIEPSAALRLVEGVLRITPDLDYVLLYLDCVRRASSSARAVRALVEALQQLDFREVSRGQLRRLLELLIELYPTEERPQVLFGLLENRHFVDCFDSAAPDLPEGLAELWVPLRAVHAVVVRDLPHAFGPSSLVQGVRALLGGSAATLQTQSRPVRSRLLRMALESEVAAEPEHAATLASLWDEERGDPARHGELGLSWARALLSRQREAEAKRLLTKLTSQHPNLRLAKRWLEAIGAKRWGRVAVVSDARSGARGFERCRGLCLDSLRPVTVYVEPRSAGATSAPEPLLLARRSPLGCCPLLHEGRLEDGRRWWAVAKVGAPLVSLVERRSGLGRDAAIRASADICGLAVSLALLGSHLEATALGCLEVDESGRIWLADWTQVVAIEAGGVQESWEATRDLCAKVLSCVRRDVLPVELVERVQAVSGLEPLRRLLETCNG